MYIVILDQDENGKLKKYQRFETGALAVAHVNQFGGFITIDPGGNQETWVIDPVEKTITINHTKRIELELIAVVKKIDKLDKLEKFRKSQLELDIDIIKNNCANNNVSENKLQSICVKILSTKASYSTSLVTKLEAEINLITTSFASVGNASVGNVSVGSEEGSVSTTTPAGSEEGSVSTTTPAGSEEGSVSTTTPPPAELEVPTANTPGTTADLFGSGDIKYQSVSTVLGNSYPSSLAYSEDRLFYIEDSTSRKRFFSYIENSIEKTYELTTNGYQTSSDKMLCVRAAREDRVAISAGKNIHTYSIEPNEINYMGTTTGLLDEGQIVSFCFYDEGMKLLVITEEKVISAFSLTVAYDLHNYSSIGTTKFPYKGPVRDIYVSKDGKIVVLTPNIIFIFPFNMTGQRLPATSNVCDVHTKSSSHFTAFHFSTDESVMQMVMDGSKNIYKFDI